MNLNVLVVDDSATLRKIIELLLKELGHTVVAHANNATEAMELYLKHKPDLVTMDIGMPNVTGLEAAKMITTLDKEAKIIMVTANGEKKTVKDSIEKGALGFVLKPVTKKKLEKSIEKIFA